jgi:hypothetical protein
MSYIQNTWVAYAFERELGDELVSAGLGRVAGHYGRLYDDPLVFHARTDGPLGMALWHPADERLRWPLWTERAGLAVASTNAITGWERLVDGAGLPGAATEVGAALAADPERLALLNPPFVIAVHDPAARSLTIVNDPIATARLYELRTEAGLVWSNRLGALPLFAGVAPQPDAEGWAIHAATGWFLGSTTPIRGARKVAAGTAIVARASEGAVRVSAGQTNAVRGLVEPRRARIRRSAAAAAEQAAGMARSIDSVWSVPPTVNFSGGRDSRISAAGFVAAGVDAEFRTMDIDPGEAELARELIAALDRPVPHVVSTPEQGDPGQGLRERIGAIHLVHDGVANPMSALQSPVRLPQRRLPRPLVTGHGGELGHGFYYSRDSLSELRSGGTPELVRRLERAGRRRHSAASDEAYRAYLGEVERTLEAGRSYGLEGPSLLDYYYLAQRLSFRAGLGSRNDRYSACATPAFIRACFDLTPRQRLNEKLHRRVVALLVPSWKRIPFFQPGASRTRRMNRDRIWAKPRHADELAQLIAEESSWGEWFDVARVMAMWARARDGGAHPHDEPVFMRLAWRACFEDHLRLLASRASHGPRVDQPSSDGR